MRYLEHIIGISTEASFGSPGGVSGDLVVVRIFYSLLCQVENQKIECVACQDACKEPNELKHIIIVVVVNLHRARVLTTIHIET